MSVPCLAWPRSACQAPGRSRCPPPQPGSARPPARQTLTHHHHHHHHHHYHHHHYHHHHLLGPVSELELPDGAALAVPGVSNLKVGGGLV